MYISLLASTYHYYHVYLFFTFHLLLMEPQEFHLRSENDWK